MSNFDTQPKGLQLSDLCKIGVMDDNETFVSNPTPLKFGTRVKSPEPNNYNTENSENNDPNKFNIFQDGLKRSTTAKKKKKKRGGSKKDTQTIDDIAPKSPDRIKLKNFETNYKANSQSISPLRPKSQILYPETVDKQVNNDLICIKHYETENNKVLKAKKSPNLRLRGVSNTSFGFRSPLNEIADFKSLNTIQTVDENLDRPQLLDSKKSNKSIMHLLQKQTDLNEELMEENEKFSKDQASLLRLLSQKDTQLKEVETIKLK